VLSNGSNGTGHPSIQEGTTGGSPFRPRSSLAARSASTRPGVSPVAGDVNAA